MITNAEAIKSRASIVEIIGELVKLKKDGVNYKGLCPFHNEKSPSFTVSKEKNIYKCFGCGKSGDLVAFLMDHLNLDYVATVHWLAAKLNMPIETEGALKSYKKPLERLMAVGERLLNFLENDRKISNNTLLRLRVTESREWMPKVQKETPVICFNYYREGELINIKFRGGGKDFKLEKDAELIFYNLDSLKGEDTAVIVEGELDALSCHEAGIYPVVSVPNGAAPGTQKLEYLDTCWQYFEDKKKIILFTDNDDPGYNLREELARRLGKERCYRVTLPADCKDANDILVKHGAKALALVVDSAVQWPIEGILSMDDMFEDVTNYYENGYPKGAIARIGPFDDLLAFMPGQVTTITGIPGSGKSEFTDYLMTSLARHHEWPFAVCSFENQPSALHVTKLMEKFTGKCFTFRKDPTQRMSQADFDQGIFMVDKYFHFINIAQVDVTLSGILTKARELIKRKGVKGLLIDPWNYIEHKIPQGYTETQYISECLTDLKAFAVQNAIHVFLIAHPTKMMKDKKTGVYEIPTMYNIAGSAHFFNKTDNGVCVSRDFSTNLVDVYVQKVRYSWLGKIGFASFNYDTFLRQYIPL